MARALLGFERILLGPPQLAQVALNRLALLGRSTGAFDDDRFRDKFTQLRLDVADLTEAYSRFADVLRRGEALGLRWADVDREAGTDGVVERRTSGGYQVQEGGPKSEAGNRPLALRPETTAARKAWRARQNAERLAWGTAWTDSGLVFTREDGTGWHPDRISKLFTRAVTQAKVPRIRLHDLRHGFAHCDAAQGPAAADSLWAREQVLAALRRLAPYQEATLLITNLRATFCPPGKRWTERRRAA